MFLEANAAAPTIREAERNAFADIKNDDTVTRSRKIVVRVNFIGTNATNIQKRKQNPKRFRGTCNDGNLNNIDYIHYMTHAASQMMFILDRVSV